VIAIAHGRYLESCAAEIDEPVLAASGQSCG